MNIFGSGAPSSKPRVTLSFGAWPQNLQAYQGQEAQALPQTSQTQPYAQQAPEQFDAIASFAILPIPSILERWCFADANRVNRDRSLCAPCRAAPRYC